MYCLAKRIVSRKVLRDVDNALADDGGVAVLVRTVDRIASITLAATTYEARRRIRGNPLLSHESRKILAPPAQHLLINVQSPPLFALGLHDQVHMRVLLVGM